MSSFSILILTYLPRALVSFLVVDEVIEKGLNPVEESSCEGKRFTANVTLAVPCRTLKSGINLRTDKIYPLLCLGLLSQSHRIVQKN